MCKDGHPTTELSPQKSHHFHQHQVILIDIFKTAQFFFCRMSWVLYNSFKLNVHENIGKKVDKTI